MYPKTNVYAAAGSTDLQQALKEIKKYMEDYFRLSLTAAIGPTVQGSRNLRKSYGIAKELLRRRFLAGGGCIFDAESLQDPHAGSAEAAVLPDDRLIDHIRRLRREEMRREIRAMIETARRMPHDQAIFALNQLLVTLFRSFNSAVPGVREQARCFMQLASSLMSFEQIDELREAFESACEAMCGALEAIAKNKNLEIIEEIKAYIEANFARHDISLESLADHYHLTPGYLGKLFKTACHMSFNDYLKQIRLEKACEWLRDTRDPANVISEKIGILNTTYFYTIFKKRYGVSPAQYRAQAIRGSLLKDGEHSAEDGR